MTRYKLSMEDDTGRAHVIKLGYQPSLAEVRGIVAYWARGFADVQNGESTRVRFTLVNGEGDDLEADEMLVSGSGLEGGDVKRRAPPKAKRTTIGVDLGPLHGPLVASAAANGRTLSAELRAALAAYLGVEVPELKPGNPAIAGLSRRANAARWGSPEQG